MPMQMVSLGPQELEQCSTIAALFATIIGQAPGIAVVLRLHGDDSEFRFNVHMISKTTLCVGEDLDEHGTIQRTFFDSSDVQWFMIKEQPQITGALSDKDLEELLGKP